MTSMTSMRTATCDMDSAETKMDAEIGIDAQIWAKTWMRRYGCGDMGGDLGGDIPELTVDAASLYRLATWGINTHMVHDTVSSNPNHNPKPRYMTVQLFFDLRYDWYFTVF